MKKKLVRLHQKILLRDISRKVRLRRLAYTIQSSFLFLDMFCLENTLIAKLSKYLRRARSAVYVATQDTLFQTYHSDQRGFF